MRLIDADALKEKAFGKRNGLVHTKDIDDMLTVDAIEVIRCKDCEHWDMVDLHFHKNVCSKLMRPCEENNYCSWAERRQDD